MNKLGCLFLYLQLTPPAIAQLSNSMPVSFGLQNPGNFLVSKTTIESFKTSVLDLYRPSFEEVNQTQQLEVQAMPSGLPHSALSTASRTCDQSRFRLEIGMVGLRLTCTRQGIDVSASKLFQTLPQPTSQPTNEPGITLENSGFLRSLADPEIWSLATQMINEINGNPIAENIQEEAVAVRQIIRNPDGSMNILLELGSHQNFPDNFDTDKTYFISHADRPPDSKNSGQKAPSDSDKSSQQESGDQEQPDPPGATSSGSGEGDGNDDDPEPKKKPDKSEAFENDDDDDEDFDQKLINKKLQVFLESSEGSVIEEALKLEGVSEALQKIEGTDESIGHTGAIPRSGSNAHRLSMRLLVTAIQQAKTEDLVDSDTESRQGASHGRKRSSQLWNRLLRQLPSLADRSDRKRSSLLQSTIQETGRQPSLAGIPDEKPTATPQQLSSLLRQIQEERLKRLRRNQMLLESREEDSVDIVKVGLRVLEQLLKGGDQ